MQLEIAPRYPARGLASHASRLRVSARAVPLAAASAIGIFVFVIYLTTLAPTVMWYDMGEFVTASATLGIAHNTGYPLLILLGKLFTFLPVGDVAYRVNLMSALFTALSVAVVFGIIHDLTEDLFAAAFGALTLAFGSTVWANATWATSYGLNLFFTALVLWLMLRWWRDRSTAALVGAALSFGLGLCNHRLIVLSAAPSPLLLALGLRSLRPRPVLLALAAFAAGLSVYLYLPIRGAQEPALSWARPADWHTYWAMFLNGRTPAQYWRIDIAHRLNVLWEYPSYDLTWAGLALAAVGAFVCARRDVAVAAALTLLLLLDAAVVETYSIHNIYNYLTPGYVVLCVLAGVGCRWTIRVVQRGTGGGDGGWSRTAGIGVAALLMLIPATLMSKNYARVDRSADYEAYDFAQTTLDRLPARAVVLTDTWSASPLWYLQLVKGYRRDVLVSPIFSVPDADIDGFAQKQMDDGRPVYAADGLSARVDELAARYTVQPVLLDSIETMLVDVLPKPQYRDDLVTKGSLYRVLAQPPVTTVARVPAGAELDVRFSSGLTLAGFATDANAVDRGGLLRLDYYWRADRAIGQDLKALTLFFDDYGKAQTRRGYPIWSQRRQVSQGVLPTSKWQPGVLVRESYFVLVPRTVPPGQYSIRLSDDAGAAGLSDDATKLLSVGHITVR